MPAHRDHELLERSGTSLPAGRQVATVCLCRSRQTGTPTILILKTADQTTKHTKHTKHAETEGHVFRGSNCFDFPHALEVKWDTLARGLVN
jgi:hypothetical protein